MTHEETIKRIQKLVPSVMELEFGCEVTKISNNLKNPVFTKGKFIRMDGMRMFCLHKDNTVFETRYGDALTSILGKPITLAVLFQAFENNNTEVELSIFANKILIGHYEKPNQEGYYTHCYWNLSKDNFNDQSEETKTFIGGLLSKY